MVSKAQKLRLAVFFIIGFSVLLFIFVILLGSRVTERRDFYRVIYEDTSVTGLQIGGAVLYRGIRIGRIEDIQIDREQINNIIVSLSVKHGTPVKADQEATLVLVGITGLKQIELTGGTNTSPFLEPGDIIPAGKSLFESISDKAEVLAVKVESIMDNIIAITNPENQEKLNNILANVDIIIDRSQEPLTDTMKNFKDITHELRQTILAVNEIVDKIDPDKVGNIVNNAETASNKIASVDMQRLDTTITTLNETLTKTLSTVNRLDALVQRNSPDLNAIIQELKETSENLNEFTRLIADDPSLLIRSSRREN
jgi:phospholipid/cholesterol/gamma-HCH transport system substrate-binding protein